MDFKDYYSTLGVAKTATPDEIKKAYRKLARKHHPDHNPGDKGAEAKFKEINEANEVLGDPDKRKKYDELGSNWRAYEQADRGGGPPTGGGSPFGTDASGAQYRTMTPEEMQEMFGGGGGADPFSDFFHTFFGGASAGQGARTGGRRGRASRNARGADLESAVDLSLEEAFTGATRRVSKEGGRSFDVKIPAGIKDGARVRVASEGESGAGSGAAGDLYLVVHVRPHPRFERDGQDLRVRVPVPVTTAVLGGEVMVPSIAGSTLRLKVPELTRAGRVFRLRGHGMPAVGQSARGDLYATVEIEMPERLSADQKKHYEALRDLDTARA